MKKLIALLCGALACLNASAATRYLATDGTDSGDALTPETAWLTLRHAIVNAASGDTIEVMAGTYATGNLAATSTANKTLTIQHTGEVGVAVFQTYLSSTFGVEQFSGANLTMEWINIKFQLVADPGQSHNAIVQYLGTNQQITFTDCQFICNDVALAHGCVWMSATDATNSLTMVRPVFEIVNADAVGGPVKIRAGTCVIIDINANLSGTRHPIFGGVGDSSITVDGGSIAVNDGHNWVEYFGTGDLLLNNLNISGEGSGEFHGVNVYARSGETVNSFTMTNCTYGAAIASTINFKTLVGVYCQQTASVYGVITAVNISNNNFTLQQHSSPTLAPGVLCTQEKLRAQAIGDRYLNGCQTFIVEDNTVLVEESEGSGFTIGEGIATVAVNRNYLVHTGTLQGMLMSVGRDRLSGIDADTWPTIDGGEVSHNTTYYNNSGGASAGGHAFLVGLGTHNLSVHHNRGGVSLTAISPSVPNDGLVIKGEDCTFEYNVMYGTYSVNPKGAINNIIRNNTFLNRANSAITVGVNETATPDRYCVGNEIYNNVFLMLLTSSTQGYFLRDNSITNEDDGGDMVGLAGMELDYNAYVYNENTLAHALLPPATVPSDPANAVTYTDLADMVAGWAAGEVGGGVVTNDANSIQLNESPFLNWEYPAAEDWLRPTGGSDVIGAGSSGVTMGAFGALVADCIPTLGPPPAMSPCPAL